MIYDNRNVRRQDRLLPEERAFQLLKQGEHGVLSMVDTEGKPYGIPVNYVWNGEEAIYIHCAPEGKKLRCLHQSPFASLCIVGHTNVIPDKFTTNYESIILSCRAETGLEAEERMEALHLLIDKYSPQFKEVGATYAKGSFHRTEIVKLSIISFSGKTKIT